MERNSYRPTWLIRTSGWERVPGNEATDGYHALSYCWEQSGEKFLKADGEYGLTDDGLHRLTKFTAYKRLHTMSSTYRRPTVNVTRVTYDQLLQQICQDFDIEYLWYDKVCIDQTNKAEKQREIKQMHLIYSNARFIVALVPEVNITDPKDFDHIDSVTGDTAAKSNAIDQMEDSLWWKRSWTLGEVMMSTQILIVGRNTHFWSLADFVQGDKQKGSDILSDLMLGLTKRDVKKANQVLYFAHFRTSTKEHDKVYALANIFGNIASINIKYDSDVSAVMNRFYGHLAENDLSIMCFGSNLLTNGKPQYASTMDSYNLPSWTGVAGLHSMYPIADVALDQNCDYTIDDNKRLHLKCRSYTIRPREYHHDSDFYRNDSRKWKAQKSYFKVIAPTDDFGYDQSAALGWSRWCMRIATDCFATHYYKPDDPVPFLSPILPLSLTDEECDECEILGVVFDSVVPAGYDEVAAGYVHNYLSPVARKSTDSSSYKIIGVILLKHFWFDEPRDSPQEVMDKMFDSLGCETQEFCIE